MTTLKGKFTRIAGSFSQTRRLPRLGKIRLGIKVTNAKGTAQHPKETPWFVVPPEVEAVYGTQPTELDVMLPHDDPEVIFPQKFAMYGQTAGLKCHGNGERAERLNEKGEWIEMACPCDFLKTQENPKGACTEQSSLMVLLPKVSMGGCYQITTGSYHSTVTINSALDYIRALAGRLALIPLKLRRVPRTTHNEGKSQTHYTLELILDGDLAMIRDLRADVEGSMIPMKYVIDAPLDENKLLDAPDLMEPEAEELAEMNDQELHAVQAALLAQHAKATPLPVATAVKATTPSVPMTPAPPAKPAPLIGAEEWQSIIFALDAVPALVEIKKTWKDENGVKNITLLNATGQHQFLTHLRQVAQQQGVPVPF